MSDGDRTDGEGHPERPAGTSPAASRREGRERVSGRLAEFVALHGLVSVVGWACLAGAAVLAVAGYLAVSGTADVAQQVDRLAGISIGALALLGIGAALLLSHHYRSAVDAVADLQRAVLDDLEQRR